MEQEGQPKQGDSTKIESKSKGEILKEKGIQGVERMYNGLASWSGTTVQIPYSHNSYLQEHFLSTASSLFSEEIIPPLTYQQMDFHFFNLSFFSLRTSSWINDLDLPQNHGLHWETASLTVNLALLSFWMVPG